MIEARYYDRLDNRAVQCDLCPHRCKIDPSQRGICGVRENTDGRLNSLNYGRVVAVNSDPIEKKPLFHFLAGTRAFSIATVGCNMKCDHCQNFRISQLSHDEDVIGQQLSPQQVVDRALARDCKTIAYTYTEPTIFFEFAYDTAVKAHKEGLYNVFVTNGYVNEEPLRDIAPYLDGCNVDLKAFSDDFYRKVAGARLEPIKDTLRLLKELGIWLEITTLIIPGLNDSPRELNRLARFIVDLDPAIPWHVSRFTPTHNMRDKPPTPGDKLREAYRIGKDQGLRFVYQGNVPGEGEATFCPNCNREIIRRFGFQIDEFSLVDGRCPHCNTLIEGVWNSESP